MKRVAVVVPSLRGGGLERIATDVAIGLSDTSMRVEVFPLRGLGVHAERLRNAGLKVHDLRAGKWRVPGVPLKSVGAICRFAPDIIHAHSGAWYPAFLARLLLPRSKLVFTEHGRYLPESRARVRLERLFVRWTDAVVVVSPALEAYMRSLLHLSESPSTILNGIDVETLQSCRGDRSRLRRDLGLSEDEIVAVAVGRLVAVKDHALLLRSLAAASCQFPRLRLLIAGTGELEGFLRALSDELGISARVKFVGYVSEIGPLLSACDFFVNTSKSEGLPMAVLEAMAIGLPVAATAVGGVPEALGVPPCGILVNSGDDVALTDAIVSLAMSADVRAEHSRRALERSEFYSLARCIDAHRALYLKICGEGPTT